MPTSAERRAPEGTNQLLGMLPNGERARLIGASRRVPLRPRDVFQEAGKATRHVYFPLSGVISLLTPLEDGSSVETATIGNDGMVGIYAFLGGGTIGNAEAIGQVSGEALQIRADHFRAEANGGGGKLRDVMLKYAQALFVQISQSVACNGAHAIQHRCARWLLEAHDRVPSDEFDLTQEFLAEMLSVRRASVTVAARTLQMAGLITYQRGHVTILDRPGLEEASCECFRMVKDEYHRLLGTG